MVASHWGGGSATSNGRLGVWRGLCQRGAIWGEQRSERWKAWRGRECYSRQRPAKCQGPEEGRALGLLAEQREGTSVSTWWTRRDWCGVRQKGSVARSYRVMQAGWGWEAEWEAIDTFVAGNWFTMFEDKLGFGNWAGEVNTGKRGSRDTGGRFYRHPSESENRR